MTEGSPYAHHDPSVLFSTYTNGVLLDPPPLLKQGRTKFKNNVQDMILEKSKNAVWDGVPVIGFAHMGIACLQLPQPANSSNA